MAEVSFPPSANTRKRVSASRELERRSLKKSGLQRHSNPWHLRYRCDALPTELWSHILGVGSIYRVHISRGKKTINWPRVRIPLRPWFFQTSSFNCLNWKIYCDVHSSPSTKVNNYKLCYTPVTDLHKQPCTQPRCQICCHSHHILHTWKICKI